VFPLSLLLNFNAIRHPSSILTCTDNKNSYLTDVPASNPTHQSPKPSNVRCQSQTSVQRKGTGKLSVVKAKITEGELLIICNSGLLPSFNRSEDRMSTSVQQMSSEK